MKLKKLKLSTLSETIMKDKEMNGLKGGNSCGCSCYWEGQGGSSVDDNAEANYTLGNGESKNGCNEFSYSPEWGVEGHNVPHK